MVRARVVEATGNEACLPAIGIHHPNCRRPAGLRSAEHDLFPIRRFAGAEIPNRKFVVRKPRHGSVPRIQPADFRAATGEVRLEIAIEMVQPFP